MTQDEATVEAVTARPDYTPGDASTYPETCLTCFFSPTTDIEAELARHTDETGHMLFEVL